MLVFEERGKPEHPEKNFSEQGREPTTNSTPGPGVKPGPQWWEASALTTAPLVEWSSAVMADRRVKKKSAEQGNIWSLRRCGSASFP